MKVDRGNRNFSKKNHTEIGLQKKSTKLKTFTTTLVDIAWFLNQKKLTKRFKIAQYLRRFSWTEIMCYSLVLLYPVLALD